MKSKPIKVLVIDDDPATRKVLKGVIEHGGEVEVIGEAEDSYDAQRKVLKLKPDVITLDIEMPGMDGLSFLEILMSRNPLPVIVISKFGKSNSEMAMKAMEMGAFDVIDKFDSNVTLGERIPELRDKVKAAAASNVGNRSSKKPSLPDKQTEGIKLSEKDLAEKILLLGASTGGTEALRDVLIQFPERSPGICIVQHIPAAFSGVFAQRLDNQCRMHVKEAEHGELVTPGKVLIAPGGYHMTLHKQREGYYVRLDDKKDKVWHQRPAVDILFNSAARVIEGGAVAAVLTGMGKDGADGLLTLRKKGVRTFVQDEATSVVYGMPRVAYEAGAAEAQVPLNKMAYTLQRAFVTKPIKKK